MLIFISAGEASGDTHGAGVVRELKRMYPDAKLFGIGGDQMQEAGVELIEHAGRMSFMGFAEVIRHMPFILATRTRVLKEIVVRRPDLILLIDYPGFHFSLLRKLKRLGVLAKASRGSGRPAVASVQNDKSLGWQPKVLYYIPPQVWAWKAGRAKELAEIADGIATIFPFEVEIFEKQAPLSSPPLKQGGEAPDSSFILHPSSLVRFVGHPLLDEVGEIRPRGEFFKSIGLEPDDRVIGLFPGSRKQEVRRHLPLLVKTVKLLRTFQPDLKFILAESPHVPDTIYARLLQNITGVHRALAVSHEILAHCNASIVKSGSTTVEAAYFGNPFVVYYKVTPLSYELGKRLVKVPFIAMANILAGEMVVKELIQHEATPENLFAAMLPLLTFPDHVEKCRAGLRKVKGQLGEPGAAKRVAEMAAELIESK